MQCFESKVLWFLIRCGVCFACSWHPAEESYSSSEMIYYYNGKLLQYNLNGSNPDGSFTLDDSNSFFSPYKILPIAEENKYLGIFSYFIMELYVVCTH